MHSQSSPARPQNVDAAIIGGGIAGSSLAIVLRREGMDIALIEREPTFRDRIRGEAIHPWGVREVHALELQSVLDEAGAISLPFWTRYRDSEAAIPYAWREDFPESPGGLSVNHVTLQNTLLQTARDAGVQVYRPAIAKPVFQDNTWHVTIASSAGETSIRAKLLIGADGQRSATRTLIGGSGRRDPIHHQMGGMLVQGVDLPRESAHQAFHEAGFGMVYLQQNDLARVYYVCPTDEARTLQGETAKDEFLRRVGTLYPESAFSNAHAVGPLGFFPNADLVADRIAGPQSVLIGDAASANDPSQGHGLALVYRDIRVLRDLLRTTNVTDLPPAFAAARYGYYNVLRHHASWAAPLSTDTGERAEALRNQVQRAREVDPSAGGFAGIFAAGPDGLGVDDTARAHFYGEDLPDAEVFEYPLNRLDTSTPGTDSADETD